LKSWRRRKNSMTGPGQPWTCSHPIYARTLTEVYQAINRSRNVIMYSMHKFWMLDRPDHIFQDIKKHLNRVGGTRLSMHVHQNLTVSIFCFHFPFLLFPIAPLLQYCSSKAKTKQSDLKYLLWKCFKNGILYWPSTTVKSAILKIHLYLA